MDDPLKDTEDAPHEEDGESDRLESAEITDALRTAARELDRLSSADTITEMDTWMVELATTRFVSAYRRWRKTKAWQLLVGQTEGEMQ